MADAKNHHYVPQAILRRFANDEGQLHVYDKWHRRAFLSSTRNVASENGFYAITIDGHTVGLECATQQIDAATLTVINRIIENASLADVTPADRTLLSIFLAFQLLRTRAARDLLTQMQDAFRRTFPTKGLDESAFPEGFFADELQLKLDSVRNLGLIADIVPVLVRKQSLLLEAPTGHEFMISDNPLVRSNVFPTPPFMSNLGLECRGIEIYMPLSPTLTLELVCEQLVQEFREHRQAHPSVPNPVLDAIDYGAPLQIVRENVDHANSLQVVNSTRFVFSSRDDFSLVERILDSNPNVARPQQIAVA